MKKFALITIGAIIAIICICALFTLPIHTSPSTNQWFVYGFVLGGIIIGAGLMSNENSDDNK